MDDQSGLSEPVPPPAEVGESQESLRDLVERLRSDVKNQAKTIDSLGNTMARLEAERNQNINTITVLRAEVYHLARHLAGQQLEERFEALHCEVSTELHYLRSLLSQPSSFCHSAPCSSNHTSDMQRQAAMNHLSQELYHSRRVLWEQIAELREEVRNIHSLLRHQRDETQRRFTERHCKDMCLERMIDTCQAQKDALRLQRPQDTHRLRSDTSEVQNRLQTITISKGKAPKKVGHIGTVQRIMPVTSDSDEGLSGQQAKKTTPKATEVVNVCARRK